MSNAWHRQCRPSVFLLLLFFFWGGAPDPPWTQLRFQQPTGSEAALPGSCSLVPGHWGKGEASFLEGVHLILWLLLKMRQPPSQYICQCQGLQSWCHSKKQQMRPQNEFGIQGARVSVGKCDSCWGVMVLILQCGQKPDNRLSRMPCVPCACSHRV